MFSIYFIKNDFGLVKIGYSSQVTKRIRGIQAICGLGLELVYEYSSPCKEDITYLEKALHQYFSKYRKHGEWFESNILNYDLEVVVNAIID